jgi:FAD dependent oxidoreductase
MVSNRKLSEIGILGGGIQGCCMALLFRKLGYRVTIIDQADDIMTRSSANQEGKIHMGFIYSNDLSFKTGTKMMLDALHFSYCMEYLLDEKIQWENLKSEKFIYLVPYDSLIAHDQIEAYFNKLQQLYTELLITHPHLSYLGEKPITIFNKAPVPDGIDPAFFKYCFQTEEVAILQNILKDYIKKALIKNGIEIILNESITRVDRIPEGRFCVTTHQQTYAYDRIINCLWENQVMVDQQLGLESRNENNLRLKFGILSNYIEELASLPSVSIVSGPYGDFVNFPYPEDRKMYFSWYPVSRYGMIIDQEVPDDWIHISNGNMDIALIEYQFAKHLEIYRQLFSRSFHFNSPKLVAGIVVANGKDDINNLNSKLHHRNEEPIYHKDGYYSISTGKYTSAPHNALLMKTIL